MLRALTVCCLLTVAPTLALGGCGVERQALRKDDDERDALGRQADLFWQAVRWGDTATAAAVVVDDTTRVRFQQWLEDQRQQMRLSDVSVLSVELDEPPTRPETAADGSRVLRRAKVVARTEGYRMPAQVLEERTETQTWLRTPTGWYLEWSDG